MKRFLAHYKAQRAAKKRWDAKYGCICHVDQGGNISPNPACPQYDQHFVGRGWGKWTCRECGRTTFFPAAPSACCTKCGSTSGWRQEAVKRVPRRPTWRGKA